MTAINDAERTYSYTLKARENIIHTVETEDFVSMDAETIFRVLLGSIREIPFREYLKRYLYLNAEMQGPFSAVDTEEYRDIIVSSFRDSCTPCSFGPGTTRLPRAAANWLTRDEVSRDSVLLMGFGLYMTEKDVDAFLTRALHGRRADPDDPREAICLYCLRHGYRFAKYQQLINLYGQMDGQADRRLIEKNHPADRPLSQIVIKEDTELLDRLVRLRGHGDTALKRRTAETFSELYIRVRERLRSQGPLSQATPRSLERIFSAGIPTGAHGNLIPERKALSSLKFARRRISRQRLHRLLKGQQAPDRYDLLTLLFFLLGERDRDQEDRKGALKTFTDAADEMLARCGFGSIYPADPFDAFLILCTLTCDPPGTYSDVMENAYTRNNLREEEDEE